MKQSDLDKSGTIDWEEYKKATYGFMDEQGLIALKIVRILQLGNVLMKISISAVLKQGVFFVIYRRK